MSGGEFDYKQFHIDEIADSLERTIANNKIKNEYDFCNDFSDETIAKLQETADLLKKVSTMVHHADWLISSDIGEETYHERINEN